MLKAIKLLLECPPRVVTAKCNPCKKNYYKKILKLVRIHPVLRYQSLHPENKKQSVKLALSVFDCTTMAACKSYFPDRSDVSGFLTLINHWWLLSNSKQTFCPNPLGNAVVANDGKILFMNSMAHWIEDWSFTSATFCFSK